VFFYVETGLRRLERTREIAEPYLRAGTAGILVLYGMSLSLSLMLVWLEIAWARAVFAVLSAILIVVKVDISVRTRPLARALRSKSAVAADALSSIWVLALVAIPWVLGGLSTSREDLSWAILLSLATGFLTTCSLLLSVFDISRFEAAARTEGSGSG
jgi:hypothetical protein